MTATIVILLAVAIITYFDLKYIAVHGLDSCDGNCTNCGTSCKWVGDVRKARRKIAFEHKLRKFFHISQA